MIFTCGSHPDKLIAFEALAIGTPISAWSPEAAERRFGDSAGIDPADPDSLVPIVTSPARILVLVAGGIGTHSMHIPTIASIPVVTRAFS